MIMLTGESQHVLPPVLWPEPFSVRVCFMFCRTAHWQFHLQLY
jgi:hypothetical protein